MKTPWLFVLLLAGTAVGRGGLLEEVAAGQGAGLKAAGVAPAGASAAVLRRLLAEADCAVLESWTVAQGPIASEVRHLVPPPAGEKLRVAQHKVDDAQWVRRFDCVVAVAPLEVAEPCFCLSPEIVFYRAGTKVVTVTLHHGTRLRFQGGGDSGSFSLGPEAGAALAELVREKLPAEFAAFRP